MSAAGELSVIRPYVTLQRDLVSRRKRRKADEKAAVWTWVYFPIGGSLSFDLPCCFLLA